MVEEEGQFFAGQLYLLYLFRTAVHPYEANAHEYGRDAGNNIIDQEYMIYPGVLLYIIQVIDHTKAAIGKQDGYQHEGLAGSLAMYDADLAIVQEEKYAVGKQEQNIGSQDIRAASSGQAEEIKYNYFKGQEQG